MCRQFNTLVSAIIAYIKQQAEAWGAFNYLQYKSGINMLGEITLTGLTSQGSPSSQLHNWRVGQVLEAVALAKPSAERLQLRIGGVELEARTQAPIQAGDRVLLKVLSAGSTPTLQVVPATVPSGSAAEIVNQALRQMLPRQLPTERVLTNLLDILGQSKQRSQLPANTRSLIETLLARIPRGEKLADHTRLRQLVTESGLFREQHQQQGRTGVDIKQSLVQLARQLGQAQWAQNPSQGLSRNSVQSTQLQNTVTPNPSQSPLQRSVSGGQQAMSSSVANPAAPAGSAVGATGASPAQTPAVAASAPRSGELSGQTVGGQLGLAAQIQQQHQQAGRQLPGKAPGTANELYLSAASQSSLQELQRIVEGGIARILLQQAQSMQQPNQEGLRWVFELPYRQGDEYRSLPMVIEREAQGDDAESSPPGWQVELSFELPELGTIQAKIMVRGEKVSASLWAERDTIAQLADAELPVLETALMANGLEVGALVCRQGQKQAHRASVTNASLLDFRI